MLAVKLVLGLIIVFFLVTFAVKNQGMVDISYFFGYEYTVRLWVAILASFGAGALLAGLGWAVSSLREKGRNWRLSRKVSRLEKELTELKQKPLPDEPGVYPVPGEEPAASLPIAAETFSRTLPPAPPSTEEGAGAEKR
ncbi:MAG: LapA family protein [Candidatus Nitrospinota bacterium M3_3B_026]